MRATESPLSSSSSPPRPVAPQSYQANVVAPAVATTLKAVAASHSPQHSKSGSTSSSTGGGGGGGGRLVATVGHHPAGPHQPLSHYQAMRPISVNGAGGDIYQNTGHTAPRSVGGGGGNIGNASCMQFHPIYGTTAVTAAGHQQQGVTVDDNGTHSDYVCMLAGGASSMDGGGGAAGATSSTYQPIFATSASLINDTPVKVQAYKADSVSIQQFPTASTAVAASQPKPPPPAALKKPEQANNKPKVNPLAPTSDANLLPPPQRRTPSLPPSSPTPSNLSSGSGSGRGE